MPGSGHRPASPLLSWSFFARWLECLASSARDPQIVVGHAYVSWRQREETCNFLVIVGKRDHPCTGPRSIFQFGPRHVVTAPQFRHYQIDCASELLAISYTLLRLS